MHSRFTTLLWLEELHAEKEIKELAIHCTFLQKGGGHLHLEVPGLSEGRPNLMIGGGTSCPHWSPLSRCANVHVVRFFFCLPWIFNVCRWQNITEGATERWCGDWVCELCHRGKLASRRLVTHQEEWKLNLCLTLQIHDERVSLRVNPEFLHSYSGEPLDVEFCYNRFGGGKNFNWIIAVL